MPDNEDLDWREYKDELVHQISIDQKLNELLLEALYWDDFSIVKKRLEVLEQIAINNVLDARHDEKPIRKL